VVILKNKIFAQFIHFRSTRDLLRQTASTSRYLPAINRNHQRLKTKLGQLIAVGYIMISLHSSLIGKKKSDMKALALLQLLVVILSSLHLCDCFIQSVRTHSLLSLFFLTRYTLLRFL